MNKKIILITIVLSIILNTSFAQTVVDGSAESETIRDFDLIEKDLLDSLNDLLFTQKQILDLLKIIIELYLAVWFIGIFIPLSINMVVQSFTDTLLMFNNMKRKLRRER